MSDSQGHSIAPVTGVVKAPAVQAVRGQRSEALTGERRPATREHAAAAATTGGNLPPAYAEYVVNQDTNDVVIRIRDASTDRVINEYPSKQVQELEKYMKNYAETLARHRAATQSEASN
jgi:hypothetical protein